MKFNEYNSFCKMFKPTIKIITRKLIKKISAYTATHDKFGYQDFCFVCLPLFQHPLWPTESQSLFLTG